MWRRLYLPLVLCLLVPFVSAQEHSRKPEVQESLQSRYRLTRLGPGVLGIHGTDNSVRHAGGIIVLRKEGLYGSYVRSQMPLNAIRGDKAELLAGEKTDAIPLLPGHRFYVVAVTVSDDAVTLGLLSTGPLSSGGKSGDVWASLNFFFSRDTIATGQMDKISPEIDQWLLPEGSAALPASGAAASAVSAGTAPAVAAVPRSSASRGVQLHQGMTRDEVIAALGQPKREISFGDRHWLEYPDVVVVVDSGKLLFVDRQAQPPVAVSFSSEPALADLYVDGKYVGSTPMTLRLDPATYDVRMKAEGFQEWRRELSVLAGSEPNVHAKLVK